MSEKAKVVIQMNSLIFIHLFELGYLEHRNTHT